MMFVCNMMCLVPASPRLRVLFTIPGMSTDTELVLPAPVLLVVVLVNYTTVLQYRYCCSTSPVKRLLLLYFSIPVFWRQKRHYLQ